MPHFEQLTPRHVIRKAFEAGIIGNGQAWMDALDARNKMSHTCDFAKFEAVIADIRAHWLEIMGEWHERLLSEALNDDA